LGLSGIHFGLVEAAQELDRETMAKRKPPVSFATILLSIVPPDVHLPNRDRQEPADIMQKLKKAGKTTWSVFKKVLEVVEEASDSCPHLQLALKGLLIVLEQVEVSVKAADSLTVSPTCQQMAKEVQDGFFNTSSKLVALQEILYRYRGTGRVKERLIGLEE
jgi:hypothetical protein